MEFLDVELRHPVRVEGVLDQRRIQAGTVRIGQQQGTGSGDLPAGNDEDALVERVLQLLDVRLQMEIDDLFGNLVGQGDYVHAVSLPVPQSRMYP